MNPTYSPAVCQQSTNEKEYKRSISFVFLGALGNQLQLSLSGSGVAKILVSNEWANESGIENRAPIDGRRGHLGIAEYREGYRDTDEAAGKRGRDQSGWNRKDRTQGET